MRRGGLAALGLCGSLLTAGVATGEAPATPAPACVDGGRIYGGECRPASVCVPGCFPQAIMCRERPVLRHYNPPWAKFLDQEHHAVPLYNKRLDRGGLDQQHLAHLPELDITIGSHLSPTWNGVYWDVTLFIDEGSDRALDRVYGFNISILSATSLFYTDLPAIIVAARSERDPLSFLYGSLGRFGKDAKKEVTAAHQCEYAAMLSELERQMCAPGAW